MIAFLSETQPDRLREHWLTSLWNVSGCEVAVNSEGLWVRYESSEDSGDLFRTLPGAYFFHDDHPLGLRHLGCSMVCRALPTMTWSTPTAIANIRLPPAQSFSKTLITDAGQGDDIDQGLGRVAIRLRPRADQCEADGLMCRIEDWLDYVGRVSTRRFQTLRFAARQDGRVLVVGRPVPALPGIFLANHDRILILTSDQWHPAVSPTTLRRRWKVTSHDWLLWIDESTVEIIPDDRFVAATRASARATAADLNSFEATSP
jgi:hypothetical protein